MIAGLGEKKKKFEIVMFATNAVCEIRKTKDWRKHHQLQMIAEGEFLVLRYLNCAPHVLAFFSLLLFFVRGENRENEQEAVTKKRPFNKSFCIKQ